METGQSEQVTRSRFDVATGGLQPTFDQCDLLRDVAPLRSELDQRLEGSRVAGLLYRGLERRLGLGGSVEPLEIEQTQPSLRVGSLGACRGVLEGSNERLRASLPLPAPLVELRQDRKGAGVIRLEAEDLVERGDGDLGILKMRVGDVGELDEELDP